MSWGRILRELHTDITALGELAEELLQLGAADDGVHSDSAALTAVPVGDVVLVVRALRSPATAAPQVDADATSMTDAKGTSAPAATALPAAWSAGPLPLPAAAAVAMPDPALRQVLLNLLTDAADHGEPPVQVEARTAMDAGAGEVVILSVSDACC